jgi:hypothetical protein
VVVEKLVPEHADRQRGDDDEDVVDHHIGSSGGGGSGISCGGSSG